jgi:hypothetical protein
MIHTLLSIALALSLPAVAAEPVPAGMDAKDEQALRDYEITAGKLDKLTDVGRKMGEYVKAHPEARQGNVLKGGGIDASVKGIESQPELVSILKAEGVAPREFVLATMSMMQAHMISSIRARYPDTKMPDNVNPKNVEFVEKHPDLKQKWLAAWQVGAPRAHPIQPGKAAGQEHSP